MRMMLDHSVGVPVFRGDGRAAASSTTGTAMVARLEAEEPFWEPGTRNGYHMINFGWTVGELVRRVSGRSLGTFFREEIAEPLGIDFWIGLPEEHEHRVAPVVAVRRGSKGEPLVGVRARRCSTDPTSIPSLALAQRRRRSTRTAGRPTPPRSVVAAASRNARGLAGMYTPARARRRRARRPRRRSTACAACRAPTNHDATLLHRRPASPSASW